MVELGSRSETAANAARALSPVSLKTSRLVAMNTVIVRIGARMHRVAFIGLIVCWVLWACVFLRVKREAHKTDVTVPGANWGIVLQGIAFCLAWVNWPRARGSVLESVAVVLESI